jgi:hypothetical protein
MKLEKAQRFESSNASMMHRARETNDRRQPSRRFSVERDETVLSWIHEFENKRIVELQREFRVLFGVKGVAGGNTTSLKLSRQLFGKKKCRNKLQGTQVRERESNSSQILG